MSLSGKRSIDLQGWQKYLLLAAILLLAFLLLTFAIHRIFANNTPGIDFYVYWQAGRAFFFEGQDPYSAEVSTRIQKGIFGREALPGEDPMHFANPAYGLLAILPWLFLSFDWAQAAWMAFNLLVLASLLFIAFPRAPRWVLLIAPFFYPLAFGLVLGNFAVLIFAILALIFAFLLRSEPLKRSTATLLGLLLAWVTIKPQSVWLFLPLVLLIAFRRKIYALLAGFAGGLVSMLAVSLLIHPGWPASWLARVRRYAGYSNYQPSREFYLGAVFPPDAIGTVTVVLAGALIIICIVLAYLWLRGRLQIIILLSWCGLTTYFLHPNSLSYEQLSLLLPPLLWAVGQKSRDSSLVFFWLGGWIFSYAVLFASGRLGAGWPVNHLPLAAYTLWMVWLHVWWRLRHPLCMEAQADVGSE